MFYVFILFKLEIKLRLLDFKSGGVKWYGKNTTRLQDRKPRFNFQLFCLVVTSLGVVT